jgi:transposase
MARWLRAPLDRLALTLEGLTDALEVGTPSRPALRAQVAAAPDATLAEHCTAWEQAHGVRVSPPTMCRALRRLGWPLKKTMAANLPGGG